jgi:hypothetical protein
MDIFIIVLRLIHIVAGVFWAGSAFMFVSFILPTASAAGPAAAPFMQRLLQSNFTRVVLIAGTLNVLAGLLMYWQDSGGLQAAWITTPTGLTLTLGGLFGIGALIFAGAVTAPGAAKLARLGREIQAGGKLPTPEQMAQIGSMQAKLAQEARLNAALLGITVIAMAIARYL